MQTTREVCAMFCVLLFFWLRLTSSFWTKEALQRETTLANARVPSQDSNKILIFWRPQKVGSSTVLSLLLSHSFRYNTTHRRRGAQNSFCIKIARCIVRGPQRDLVNMSAKTLHVLRQYQQEYVTNLADHKERAIESTGYSVVLSHQICNLPYELVSNKLVCAFTDENKRNQMRWISRGGGGGGAATSAVSSPSVTELFLVRDPVDRLISIYYFWGELYRIRSELYGGGTTSRLSHNRLYNVSSSSSTDASSMYLQSRLWSRFWRKIAALISDPWGSVLDGDHPARLPGLVAGLQPLKLGQSQPQSQPQSQSQTQVCKDVVVRGELFSYHGCEDSVPPLEMALSFAHRFPLSPGLPGPSLTWSALSDSPQAAGEVLSSNKVISLVVERLDESLVVACNLLGWSLADVVAAQFRKTLSKHPKKADWPKQVVQVMTEKLIGAGEYHIYEQANAQLDRRIAALKADMSKRDGLFNFEFEVSLLREMRRRVSEMCATTEQLAVFRKVLQSHGLHPHHNQNTLRDVPHGLVSQHHAFSFNGDLLFTPDVCGACLSHGLLRQVRLRMAQDDSDSSGWKSHTWNVSELVWNSSPPVPGDEAWRSQNCEERPPLRMP